MKAAPFPWSVDEQDFVVRDAEGGIVMIPGPEIKPLRKLVTMRRMVAAVNATQHFTTGGMEGIVGRGDELGFALRESTHQKNGEPQSDRDFMAQHFGVRG